MNAHPLVDRNPDDAIARRGSQLISVSQFCGDIEALKQTLPKADYLVNLCQDRYSFTITFFAALANRQTTLLPAKRDATDARLLAEKYGDCAVVSDQTGESADLHIDFEPGSNGDAASPSCLSDHIAAIAFTSGSTGEPQAHAKSWGLLNAWRNVHFQYLPDAATPRGLVATVPSWHMYGLEWAMLLPTVAPLTTYYGLDFYPQDVMNAIAAFSQPAILVSTPVHLHALTRTTNPAENLAAVLCATAPLDKALTDLVEQHFATELFEIYGCSEIGSLAYRYPSRLSSWTFFDCFDLNFEAPNVTVSHAQLPEPVTLTDAFEKDDDDGYRLLGRATDIIKVGGKRESLANLNSILTRIPGVTDGIIFLPESLGLPKTGRLVALVVAPSLEVSVIRSALGRQIDSSFLPRPIRLVQELPRDRTSKLRQSELAKLAREETSA